MGRGLSPLQRHILLLAHDNREAGRSGQGPDIHTAEIIATVYGFPVPSGRDPRDSRHQTFSREEIGTQAYGAAAAAVSRTLRRLEERGLLTRHTRAGGRLTEAGHQTAAGLSTPKAHR